MKWNKELTECVQQYFDWLFNTKIANVRVKVAEEKEHSDISFEEQPPVALIDVYESIQEPSLEDLIKEKIDELLIVSFSLCKNICF